MANMSFVVPDDVKKAFDKAYHGQNISAVMTELIKEAIEKEVPKRTPPIDTKASTWEDFFKQHSRTVDQVTLFKREESISPCPSLTLSPKTHG